MVVGKMWGRENSVAEGEAAHNETPQLDLRCLQFILFSYLAVLELNTLP